jgi:drug/metabolite transporter (DMT)-like permease
MVVVLSLAAAICYAAGYVLQYHEAHSVPNGLRLSPRSLAILARHPLWLAGIGVMFAGNGLQAAALDHGSLAVVEPVLTTSLLFALPLSAAWRGERLTRQEWLGAVGVCSGLGVMLGVGSPTAGVSTMPGGEWLLTMLSGWGVALALVSASKRSTSPAPQAALMGLASGVLFGMEDALTPYLLHGMSHGLLGLLLSWQLYMFVITGIYGIATMQSAYSLGPLTAALPTMSVGEPIVGMLVGIFALGEHMATSQAALGLEAAAAAVMIAGTWVLGRSPLVCGRLHPTRIAAARLREIEARLLHPAPATDTAPIG